VLGRISEPMSKRVYNRGNGEESVVEIKYCPVSGMVEVVVENRRFSKELWRGIIIVPFKDFIDIIYDVVTPEGFTIGMFNEDK